VRSPGQPRFGRVFVAPKASETVDLIEEGAVVERIAAEQLTSQRLNVLLAQATSDDVKAVLNAVKADLVRAESAQAKVALLDARLRELDVDLARNRENLASIGKVSAPEIAKKLGEKLLALEETLTALRRERQTTFELATAIRRQLSGAKTQVSTR
jgi:hypothetical protein